MTTRIQVSDTGLEVIPPRDILAQGSENTLALSFEFLGEWAQCDDIKATFLAGQNSAIAPISGNSAIIPAEVLQEPWRFVYIALHGTTSGGILSSPFIRLGHILPSGYADGGGKFITMAQLQDILADYALSADLSDYVTQEQLESALEEYVKISEAATKSDIAALQTAVTNKADKTTVDALAARADGFADDIQSLQNTKADKTELGDYWSKAEIGLQTSGAGSLFLADDGTYKSAQGGTGGGVTPEELAAIIADYLKKAEAAQEYTTSTDFAALSATVLSNTAALAGKADKTALQDYETTAHAAETFAAKSDIPTIDATLTPGSPNPVAGGAVVTAFGTYSGVLESMSNNIATNADNIETLQNSAIKGIKWGNTTAEVDENGVAKINSLTLSANAVGTAGDTHFVYTFTNFIAENKTNIPLILDAADYYVTAGIAHDFLIFGQRVPTYDEMQAAINGMATESWVKQYIAGLDGTNMQF